MRTYLLGGRCSHHSQIGLSPEGETEKGGQLLRLSPPVLLQLCCSEQRLQSLKEHMNE